MQRYKIGVIGYSSQDFNITDAVAYIRTGIMTAIRESGHKASEIAIVSGLTNIGIPGIAYYFADVKNLYTIGLAPEEANKYEKYPVDKEIIVGKNFGDESEEFINYIDALVRVGGGKQSMAERDMFVELKGTTNLFEYNL